MSVFPEFRNRASDMITRVVSGPSRDPAQPFGERVASDIIPTRVGLFLQCQVTCAQLLSKFPQKGQAPVSQQSGGA